MSADAKITKRWLEERCARTEEGCLVWKRYIYINKGHDVPKARPTKDSQPVQVRRLVWRFKTGEVPAHTDHIIRTCDTWGCVWCIAKRTPADALKGRKLPIQHRAKIAQAQRARGLSDLTPDKVQEIKESPLSLKKEAKRIGVGASTVAEIRRGRRWQEYANPFAGLMA